MLYTEKLTEIGATSETVSVTLKNRIKRFEKFKKEVEANKAKREEGVLSKKASEELEEAEATLLMENDNIVEALAKWHKNKDLNAARAERLNAARQSKNNPSPPAVEITDEAKAQLAALHYTNEQIAAFSAENSKSIIESGTVNPEYQQPSQQQQSSSGQPAAKKSGTGVGMVLGLLALGALAFFGVKAYNNSRS